MRPHATCPRLGENQGLRAIPASAQESRDAICTFETHPASRPPATAWPNWSAVRVHVCRHRTELATPRQAHRTCAAGTCVRARFVSIALWHSFRSVVSRAFSARALKAAASFAVCSVSVIRSPRRLLQQNRPKADQSATAHLSALLPAKQTSSGAASTSALGQKPASQNSR